MMQKFLFWSIKNKFLLSITKLILVWHKARIMEHRVRIELIKKDYIFV